MAAGFLSALRARLPRASGPRVRRLGVIVGPEMLAGDEGASINGPSLIRVPDWLPNPLGRYYLYFAHHAGRHIRLAHADSLGGPWTVHPPGALRLGDCGWCRGHVASPDVHLDEGSRRIVMYFHAPVKGRPGQHTFAAVSADGIRFVADPAELGPFYFRVWCHRGVRYALAKGRLYRAEEPLAPYVAGRELDGRIRHTAVDLRGDRLDVYFSRVGDAPEHILVGTIDLAAPWDRWELRGVRTVIRPEADWEGAGLPVAPSAPGAAPGDVNELRDPGIFREDGRCFLLYSVRGERGIALAELLDAPKTRVPPAPGAGRGRDPRR